MTFEELTEFKKDLKGLLKRYRTLNDDLEVVKRVLEITPDERPPFSFRVDNLGLDTCIIKVKKIACRALKGRGVNSGLRLIYAYYEEEQRIIFIELYHKNENRDRILENFKSVIHPKVNHPPTKVISGLAREGI
jgi:mRNA-degrading endonuclease YafQ of YafQ-DinJ toxin-antitoxin module